MLTLHNLATARVATYLQPANMSSSFEAATVAWIRGSDPDNLSSRLQRILRQHPETQSASVRWRHDTVTDFRPRQVPRMVERLVRWDSRHPDNVFSYGFEPLRRGDSDSQMDLWTFVQENTPSIFVATARCYRNQAGASTRWIPRNRNNVFEYEVLAPGGIDVNESVGWAHQYANQREITFPGGIRREFIRSAREYNANGQVVRIWENGFFLENSESLAVLDLIADPPIGPKLEVVYWTGPQDHTRLKRSAEDDPMQQDGQPEVDESLQGRCPMMQPRAAFQRPGDHNQAYFFTANEFVRIKVVPATTNDVILNGPKTIIADWPSLKKAGFAKIDAVLPSPDGKGKAYFFSQDRYALIQVIPETCNDFIIAGPYKTLDKWPSLRQAKFNRLDAVLPNPSNSDEAYFFCGKYYALIKIKPGTTDDYIVNGPKLITNEWPSLRKAGFSTVDAAFLSPKDNGEAYFFSGDQYACIMIKPGTNDDYIVTGPKRVADNWPSLRKAGFYE